MELELKRPQPNTRRPTGQISCLLLRAIPRIFCQASTEWVNDNAPRLGAAVAFYALLSLAPAIVIAIAVAAFVYGQEAAEGRLASQIRGMAGSEVARTIQELIRGAYQPRTGVIATLLSLSVALAEASIQSGFGACFITAHDPVSDIGRLDRRMRIWLAPNVLVIDEMGYLPPDELGATIFFQCSVQRTDTPAASSTAGWRTGTPR